VQKIGFTLTNLLFLDIYGWVKTNLSHICKHPYLTSTIAVIVVPWGEVTDVRRENADVRWVGFHPMDIYGPAPAKQTSQSADVQKTSTHRYLKKSRLLKFCCVPATSTTFLPFFVAATKSTNETNKAGSTCQ
jgi:hypothetical protein